LPHEGWAVRHGYAFGRFGVAAASPNKLWTERRCHPDYRLILLYAATLEYLQNFSPGRNPALVDFAASAFGALCDGLVIGRWRYALPGDVA